MVLINKEILAPGGKGPSQAPFMLIDLEMPLMDGKQLLATPE